MIVFLLGIGDWGLGIGDWGLGIGPNPQSPIPNPQSPFSNFLKFYFIHFLIYQILNERRKNKRINRFIN